MTIKIQPITLRRTIERTVLFICSIMVVLVYLYFTNSSKKVSQPSVKTDETKIQEDSFGNEIFKNESEELTEYNSVAYKLASSYLDQYIYPKTREGKSIYEYRINTISNIKQTDNQITFLIVFSIKPVNSEGETVGTDNGISDGNGWIINKTGQVLATKQNEEYVVTGIGTGVGVPR